MIVLRVRETHRPKRQDLRRRAHRLVIGAPTPNGGPARPVDVSVRCRVLAPSHRLRYSPGSLLIIVGPEASEPAQFAERVIEERRATLAPTRVRALLAGRVPEGEIEERTSELLASAVLKRLHLSRRRCAARGLRRSRARTVRAPCAQPPAPATPDPLGGSARESTRRRATGARRTPRSLDAGELGLEGFQTALRLGGHALESSSESCSSPRHATTDPRRKRGIRESHTDSPRPPRDSPLKWPDWSLRNSSPRSWLTDPSGASPDRQRSDERPGGA